MACSLKFRIQEVDGIVQSCSENKGADQLRGLPRADGLRLCFRICIKAGFLMTLFINKDLDKDFRMSDTKLQNEPLDKKKLTIYKAVNNQGGGEQRHTQ